MRFQESWYSYMGFLVILDGAVHLGLYIRVPHIGAEGKFFWKSKLVTFFSIVKLNFESICLLAFFIWGHLSWCTGTWSFWPFYTIKTGQKYANLTKWPKITFRVPKMVPKVSNRGFWGWFGSLKVVSEFWFGHPKCHFLYPQNDKNGLFLLFTLCYTCTVLYIHCVKSTHSALCTLSELVCCVHSTVYYALH